ncbi:MAG: protein kinase [Kofleriaceae bacterium]
MLAGTKLGRYVCTAPLHGADLWIAHTDEGVPRHVVLRVVDAPQTADPSFVKLSDAWVSGELRHPCIAEIEDLGEDAGRHYIASEYVHGEALVQVLARLEERGKQIPLQHILAIGSALAEAMHHASELGIHSAITPANVLLGYDGRIKVDLGRVGAAPRVGYRAPEEVQDRRSNVFSIGIVLFECATLNRLFKTDKPQRVPKPSSMRKGLPSEIERILMKALASEPAQRYATAEELRAALAQFATKAGMAFSADSIAAYLKTLFPRRDEPWVTGGAPSDASRSFGAPVPRSERASTVASPSRARSLATPVPVAPETKLAGVDPTTQTVVPSGDEYNEPTAITPSPDLDELKSVSRIAGRSGPIRKPALPPPSPPVVPIKSSAPALEAPRPKAQSAVQAILARAAAVEAAGPDTEPSEPTMITTPPPPPLVIASTAAEIGDSTAVVKPLPSPTATRPPTARTLFPPGPGELDAVGATPRSHRKLVIAGAIAAAILIPLVIILWPTSYATPVHEPVAEKPSLPRPADDPDPVPVADPASAEDREPVAAGSGTTEPVPVEPVEPVPVAPVEPAPIEEVAVVPAAESPPDRPAAFVPRNSRKPARKLASKPVKVAAKPKAAARPQIATKPASKAKKPVTKSGKVPTYDPDSLFLNKK